MLAQPAAEPSGAETTAAAVTRSHRVPLFSLDLPEDAAEREHIVRRRNRWIMGTSTVALLAYGQSRWWSEGLDSRFKNNSEGWFDRSTTYGGIDKVGHAFSTYAGVRLLTPVLEAVGNDRDSALAIATLGTLAAFSAVEVIDGYSREHRFSSEDLLANIVGGLAGIWMESSPRLDAVLDFRLGYRREPLSGGRNLFGDYEGQRYFLVFKADGLPPLRASRLARYLEFSVGYGVRGFKSDVTPAPARQFERYAGISVNLSALLADTAYQGRRGGTRTQRNLDRAFELFQLSPGAWHQSLH